MASDLVSSLPPCGENKQPQDKPALQQQSALIFVLSKRHLTYFPVWLPLQIFGICLAQNLVSDVRTVKANWWQERWREGIAPLRPHQSQHSTQTVLFSWVRRAKNVELYFTTELSSTFALSRMQTSKHTNLLRCLSVTLEGGEENIPSKPNGQQFVYRWAGIGTQI